MSATTTLTGVVNGSSAIATSLSAPTVGTKVQAGDVQTGEQTLINNCKTIKNGSPTVTGCWTFTGVDGSSGQAAITCTGNNAAGMVCTGTNNGQGALCQGAGNGAGVEGVGGGGTNGYGGLFIGGAGGADALVAQADTTPGNNGNGATCTGHGTGDGVVGQGGANGNGMHGTGGATSGHGVVGTSQDVGSAAVKGEAAIGGGGTVGAAFWAHQGGYHCDANTPGTSPPANTMFADKFVAATGQVSVDGSGTAGAGVVTAACVNCAVTIDGTDSKKLNVSFDTDMANGVYCVVYGAIEETASGSPVAASFTVHTIRGSKTAGGFGIHVYLANGTPIDWNALGVDVFGFDFIVIGAQ